MFDKMETHHTPHNGFSLPMLKNKKDIIYFWDCKHPVKFQKHYKFTVGGASFDQFEFEQKITSIIHDNDGDGENDNHNCMR